jgi:endo-1,4-beta-mannosidase
MSAHSRARNRKAIQEYKELVGCSDCHEHYPHYVLDFDHLPGHTETMKVADVVDYSWDRIVAELAKCEVVCANCHRIRTYERGQNYRGATLRNGTSTHKRKLTTTA